ncbi:hypothetical protein MPSEU_000801800 [Mayamaea pseudoterrestris]|nr:hypothetical protein MPSEU_000801800 [Mayamaea pseudoterrestris]
MKIIFVVASLAVSIEANNNDLFYYGFSDVDIEGGTAYGQQNWGDVTCDNLEECSGYPDKYLQGKGFSVGGSSNCLWCPENGPQNCGLHRQSPINLERNRGLVGDPMEKECPDWHFMHAQEGSCVWEDLLDQFEIERHALKLKIPVQDDGEIDCVDTDGLRRFPRTDYSKGFPDWWWMDHTSIQVPSQHTQEGKRYDAEVQLNQFYEIEHPKNQLGSISVFLDAYNNTAPWPMLDKLICQWRKVEEEARSGCGLEPSPPQDVRLVSRPGAHDAWTAELKGELFAYTRSPNAKTTKPPIASANETEAHLHPSDYGTHNAGDVHSVPTACISGPNTEVHQ